MDLSEDDLDPIGRRNSQTQTATSPSKSLLHLTFTCEASTQAYPIAEKKAQPEPKPSSPVKKQSSTKCNKSPRSRTRKGLSHGCAQEKRSMNKKNDYLIKTEDILNGTRKGERPRTCGLPLVPKLTKSRSRQRKKERPFCCSLCGADFSSIEILSYHLRTHTRERPYGCELCTAACCSSFPGNGGPWAENRIHIGERLLQCTDGAPVSPVSSVQHTRKLGSPGRTRASD